MALKIQPKPRRGSVLFSETSILLTSGVLLFLLGIALVVAPEYTPKAQRVADILTGKLGLHGSTLSLAGLVFCALGVFCRRVSRLSRSEPTTSRASGKGKQRDEGAVDVALVVEQVASEVAQLRNAIQLVSSSVNKNAETLMRVLQAQDTLGQMQDQPAGGGPGGLENDPVFRLAGSLDRMHARLDEGLHSLMARLDERPSPAVSPSVPSPSPALPASTDDSYDQYPVHEIEEAEELEVVINVEDDTDPLHPPVTLDEEDGMDWRSA